MVDLSKLQEGDTVKFRCGAEHKVTGLKENTLELYDLCFYEDQPEEEAVLYYRDGLFYAGQTTPFDIIEIIPKPFDWDDVKYGMCFIEDFSDQKYWYLCEDFAGDCKLFVTDIETLNVDSMTWMRWDVCNKLIRAPKHDVCVT